ncbi:tyrosine-type recombinase/integrase [Marinobacter sp. MA]|uniref:tyrosine-type recombinase/integrase n=1 Tax=Marinobacter sp. MA TaxID=2971606 RepID=UPI003AABBCC9
MAKMIIVEGKNIPKEIVISSTGEAFPLSYANQKRMIVSLSDKNGKTIRHANRWLSYLSKAVGTSISPKTVEQYGRSIEYFCSWLEQTRQYPNIEIDEALEIITREDVLEWHEHQLSKGRVGNSTLHSREAALKAFLSWLTSKEGGRVREIADSPWGRTNDLNYVARRGHRKSPKFITPEHIVQLLNSMHNECERCMFHTQYDTGLRISELIGLKRSDLPPDSIFRDQGFEFIPLCIRGSKGRAGSPKERITLISRAVLNRIRKYHNSVEYRLAEAWKINDPNKPVFLTANGRPWSTRNASKQFKSAVARSNVGGEFSTHWMRHGTAFSILGSDIGKDYEDRMLTAQQMLGHSHLGTTEIYTQISPALLSKLTEEGSRQNRLHEAEDIRKATFLPPLKHREKRGHRNA